MIAATVDIGVEGAGHKSKPVRAPPEPYRWNYARFADPNRTAPRPHETIGMTFPKRNAAGHGFNPRAINEVVFPPGSMTPARVRLRRGSLTVFAESVSNG